VRQGRHEDTACSERESRPRWELTSN
jgi:hypothetical protein